MKKIIEHLPLLTICLLYFAFCNLHFYYNEFKIEIYNYISPSEILFSFLPTIVWATVIVYGYTINVVFLKSQELQKNTLENSEEKKEKELPKTLMGVILDSIGSYVLVYYILHFTIKIILLKAFHYKQYELQAFYFISALVFCLVICFYIIKNKKGNIITEHALLFSVCLFAYIGFQFYTIRSLEALKVKNGVTDRKVSFKYDNRIVTTSQTLIFIGQTQSNLFLYNKKDSTAVTFKTSNIDSLTIK